MEISSSNNAMLQYLHRWIWRDPERRARKLFTFAETEADGARDLVRAAELTQDATLRRLFTLHAGDEERHAQLFRARAAALSRKGRSSMSLQLNWLSPGERGLDDLRVHAESDAGLLAFLHLSEKAAAGHFAAYVDALKDDAPTSSVFRQVLKDESFHMNYTLAQLTRVAPQGHRLYLWKARLSRLWKAYLRCASAIAGVMGTVILTLQYFILLPPFALLAKRAARREPAGWAPVVPECERPMESQY
jgi:rubrerythrin